MVLGRKMHWYRAGIVHISIEAPSFGGVVATGASVRISEAPRPTALSSHAPAVVRRKGPMA